VGEKISMRKVDIAVLVMGVVLLVATAGVAGSGGRRKAKEAVCLSNLRSWGKVFARDNDNHFVSGEGYGSGLWWLQPLQPYWADSRLLLCPQAAGRLVSSSPTIPNMAGVTWQVAWQGTLYVGSYGLNGWVCNTQRSSGVWGRPSASRYWKSPDDPAARTVPVLADMWWTDAWPRETDVPPTSNGAMPENPATDEIQRVCIDRHHGAVNCLFMDGSSRRVGLKELWTLKWHREYNTEGPWTKAGGAKPEDWPEWMRKFKDY
jgi:hypothetical protein